MSDGKSDEAVTEIAASLKRRAEELWGAERADAVRPVIEETAEHIWRLSQDPSLAERDPGSLV